MRYQGLPNGRVLQMHLPVLSCTLYSALETHSVLRSTMPSQAPELTCSLPGMPFPFPTLQLAHGYWFLKCQLRYSSSSYCTLRTGSCFPEPCSQVPLLHAMHTCLRCLFMSALLYCKYHLSYPTPSKTGRSFWLGSMS